MTLCREVDYMNAVDVFRPAKIDQPISDEEDPAGRSLTVIDDIN